MSLLDEAFAWFDGASKARDEADFQGDVDLLNSYITSDHIEQQISIMQDKWPNDLRLPTLFAAARARVGQNKDLGPFGSIATAIVGGFADLEGDMGTAIASLLQANLAGDANGIGTAIGSAVEPVFQMMIDAMEAGGQQVPPDVAAKLKDSIVPIISLGLTLEIASDIAEFAMPTKMLGTGGIAHFIHDTIGFSTLSAAYTTPVREALIDIPTRYNIMSLIQPWAVRPQEAIMLLRKRQLTLDQYATTLRYTGIQERYIPLLQNIAWREFSMRDIQRMFDVGAPDAGWVTEKIQRMGWSDADVPKIRDSLYQRAVQADVGNIRTLQRSQYKAGAISKDDYLADLAARGITSTQAQPFLDAVDAENVFEVNKDLQSGYELQFSNGRSTEAQLRAALGTLNLQQATIDARVKYLTTKKLGKLTSVTDSKVLTRADIDNLYKDGKLTKQAAAQKLQDIGWSADDAMICTDLVDDALADAVTAEWVRAYEKATTYGRQTTDDLYQQYLTLGKSEAWATARKAYIDQMVLGKEKTA